MKLREPEFGHWDVYENAVNISWDSQEYRDHITEMRASMNMLRQPFGHYLAHFEDAVSKPDHPIARTFLDECKRTFSRILADKSAFGHSEIRLLFAEALHDPGLSQDPVIQEITGGNIGDPRAPAHLFDAYLEGKIGDVLLIKILRLHANNFYRSEKIQEKEVEAMKDDFLRLLNQLIADPNHPLTEEMLPASVVKERMDMIETVIADPLTLSKHGPAVGGFNSHFETISLVYERPGITFRKKSYHEWIYRHEMFHGLSGRDIKKLGDNVYINSRLGLNQYNGEINHWLNEAVTAQLTQDLRGKSRNVNMGSYTFEREIYRQLLLRVPEELFLKAYFENTEPNAAGPTPNFDILDQALRAEFGRDILAEIDRNYHQCGPADALRLFNKSI